MVKNQQTKTRVALFFVSFFFLMTHIMEHLKDNYAAGIILKVREVGGSHGCSLCGNASTFSVLLGSWGRRVTFTEFWCTYHMQQALNKK